MVGHAAVVDLLRTHVVERANDLPELSEHRLVCEALVQCLRQPKIDYLGNWRFVVQANEYI